MPCLVDFVESGPNSIEALPSVRQRRAPLRLERRRGNGQRGSCEIIEDRPQRDQANDPPAEIALSQELHVDSSRLARPAAGAHRARIFASP